MAMAFMSIRDPQQRRQLADIMNAEIQKSVEEFGGGKQSPIATKDWVEASLTHAEAFDSAMDEKYGKGQWKFEGAAWDIKGDIESLGLDYKNKGFSTDVMLRVQPLDKNGNPNGPARAQKNSLKKDENIFFFNGSINEVNNFVLNFLDDKERKLTSNDLMICDGNGKPMCIAGIFGGSTSGVKKTTTNIFLESAVFNAITIRKSSVHHGLRTDAATRFEKGVDISNAINVLKRAAQLIQQVAGGTFSSEVIDVYPDPKPKTEIAIKNHYLKKLSGKNYHADAVKRILSSLGFEILKEGLDELRVAVPYSKPDISLPADIVEEILRIDGLDNIEIPANINITPAVDELSLKENLREKIANYLVGLGFHEIFTNSITNSFTFCNSVPCTPCCAIA